MVAGEGLVDLVLESDGRAAPKLGGGPFNAARTLGRLGVPTVFIGRLSDDEHGRALRLGLRASGVLLNGIVTTADPTTFARVEVDGDGVADYRFYLQGTASLGLLPADARSLMPSRVRALHVGGLALTAEPAAAAIAALVREAGEDTVVVLDANCRPSAVHNPAAYRARVNEIVGRADVVKVSGEDLAYLDPELPQLHVARRMLDRGPSVVLLTHGAGGATVLTAEGDVTIAAVPARVIDTIGAGDAFGAAWLAAWIGDGLTRADLGDLRAAARAAEFAAMVAAQTCERAGAEPPFLAAPECSRGVVS